MTNYEIASVQCRGGRPYFFDRRSLSMWPEMIYEQNLNMILVFSSIPMNNFSFWKDNDQKFEVFSEPNSNHHLCTIWINRWEAVAYIAIERYASCIYCTLSRLRHCIPVIYLCTHAFCMCSLQGNDEHPSKNYVILDWQNVEPTIAGSIFQNAKLYLHVLISWCSGNKKQFSTNLSNLTPVSSDT